MAGVVTAKAFDFQGASSMMAGEVTAKAFDLRGVSLTSAVAGEVKSVEFREASLTTITVGAGTVLGTAFRVILLPRPFPAISSSLVICSMANCMYGESSTPGVGALASTCGSCHVLPP